MKLGTAQVSGEEIEVVQREDLQTNSRLSMNDWDCCFITDTTYHHLLFSSSNLFAKPPHNKTLLYNFK